MLAGLDFECFGYFKVRFKHYRLNHHIPIWNAFLISKSQTISQHKEMNSNSKNAGSSLDSLISSFNARILQLQELTIARNS